MGEAVGKMYEDMADAQLEQMYAYKEAGEKDRELIKDQNAAMAADMQKAITQAIQKGEAGANAVAQRARSHLAAEKQSMLIEITNTVEETADQLFKTVQGKHQNIADNYLSLKAYAISAESKVDGLVNEYVTLVNGVRMRWPMGLGKYLLLKLEASMSEKGVLQVDKVAEKAGNWVYINGE